MRVGADMSKKPLVSVIINNYNYGRFLEGSIECALDQSYEKTEVIVVDDGSTDHSRQVLSAYGGRIITVLKDNGGQASALNAGFARSRGEIVIFLDADDMLLPSTAQRIAGVFQANPGLARVQYRLGVVDVLGRQTGSTVPPAYLRMPDGDMRRHPSQIANYAGWWPPTSGHAFSSWSLRQILPMPETAFRLCADYYLVRANALCAPLLSLDEVCGYYRFHGSNHFHDLAFNLDQTRRRILLTLDAHPFLKTFAESRGVNVYSCEATNMSDVIFLAQRMASLKLDAPHHPVPEDRLLSLFCRGALASVRRSHASWPMRLLYLLWFAAIVSAPRRLAYSLAGIFFHPETRTTLSNVLGFLQYGRRSK
jgi:hypothetical protein